MLGAGLCHYWNRIDFFLVGSKNDLLYGDFPFWFGVMESCRCLLWSVIFRYL